MPRGGYGRKCILKNDQMATSRITHNSKPVQKGVIAHTIDFFSDACVTGVTKKVTNGCLLATNQPPFQQPIGAKSQR